MQNTGLRKQQTCRLPHQGSSSKTTLNLFKVWWCCAKLKERKLLGNHRFNCRTLSVLWIVPITWPWCLPLSETWSPCCYRWMRSFSRWYSQSARRRPRLWLSYQLETQSESNCLDEKPSHCPNSDPADVVSNFQHLGSTMRDDCSLSAEVEACIIKASRPSGRSTGFCDANTWLSNSLTLSLSLSSLMVWKVLHSACHIRTNCWALDEVIQNHHWHIIAVGKEKHRNSYDVQTAENDICALEEETLLCWAYWVYEGWTCPKTTPCLCPWTWQEICWRIASLVEQSSDKRALRVVS